jgi:hypothetical protein
MNPLKKITLTQKNKNGALLFLIFFCLGFNVLQAQVKNYGPLHIDNGGTFFVKSGTFTFGTSSSTTTSRTAVSFGKLLFHGDADHSGAATGAALFINGYASSLSNSYFVLPTGQSTTYAPIGITNSAVTSGVSASFISGTPSNSTTLNAAITALYSVGSWKVYGDNAKITLIWNSDISGLSASIADLTLAGYNPATSKWELIPSATPTGNSSAGTIQSSNDIILAGYNSFTLAKKGVTCPFTVPTLGVNGPDVTWNGTWSSTPDLTSKVTLLSSGSPGNFQCYSLDVNGTTLTITDGQTVVVGYDVTGTGLIKLSSQASLFQLNDASTCATTVELTKSSRSGMIAHDYIYWGSPLKESVNTYAQLANAQAFNTNNTISSGATGALDYFYKYIGGDTTTAGGWQILTSNPVTGSGFIGRIKNQAPFATFGIQNPNDHINLKFTGLVNNGTISVPIANNLASPESARNFNFFGNPYPSAIDADKFLEYNTDLDGAIYIWKATTPASGVDGHSYGRADYIAYTRAGATAVSGISSTLFGGKIATGQGFRVKVITASGTGNATFNNCMRISGNNNNFNRTGIINRYKLNLIGADNVGNQILVAYMPEATLGYDRMYDAEISSVSPAQIYSILDNATTKLGINARPTFTTTDVVQLGIDKSNTTTENFTIAIAEKEGIFQGTAINVLLHDKLLRQYQNLSNGPYNFTSNTTSLKGRFEIVYQQSALNNPDFATATVFATINSQALKINASLPMTNVTVYDLTGRLITSLTLDNQLQVSSPFNYALGIYIVKIKLNNGQIATQKIINK